jgi:hypothetical protein
VQNLFTAEHAQAVLKPTLLLSIMQDTIAYVMARSQGNFKPQPGKVKCNIDASFHNDFVGISAKCVKEMKKTGTLEQ